MERPECCINRCLTKAKSIKVKDIIYYLFPTDTEWAKKWEKRIKEFDANYRRKSNDIVCSLHFAKTSMQPVSRQLVDHALPVLFPPKTIEMEAIQNAAKHALDTAQSLAAISTMCCINGCSTKFNDPDNTIQAFEFPDNYEKRKTWIFLIQLYNNQMIEWMESMRICGLHFKAIELTADGKLRDIAKPSIFKHATARRKEELAKQRSQQVLQTQKIIQAQPNNQTQIKAQSVNQKTNPIKIHSINVPLHQTSGDKQLVTVNQAQSMTQRSAPIVGRRLSLPYARLPTLIPKPGVLKRVNTSIVNGQQLTTKIQRINNGNSGTIMIKRNQRPVPGLNKVINIPIQNNVNANATIQPIVSVLRKSMPPPMTRAQTVNVAASKLIAIKPGQITRLPPTLKPKPQVIAHKTYSKNSIDTCTKLTKPTDSIKEAKDTNETNNESIVEQNNSNSNHEERNNDIIVIDDDDVEMVMAFEQHKSLQGEIIRTFTIKNDVSMCQYTLKDPNMLKHPRNLLDRILANKQINEKLRTECARVKKLSFQMNKQYRLQHATTITETIEIS